MKERNDLQLNEFGKQKRLESKEKMPDKNIDRKDYKERYMGSLQYMRDVLEVRVHELRVKDAHGLLNTSVKESLVQAEEDLAWMEGDLKTINIDISGAGKTNYQEEGL